MNINLLIKKFSLKKTISLVILFLLGLVLNSCNQKVSVTPPDTPPPDGYIFINSYPKGFHIYLNGQQRRRATPDSLTWLKTGTYQITLKKEFFRDTSFMVNVVEGEKKSAFIDFSKDPLMLGKIFCDSKPNGAEILINDSSTGHITPDTLKNIIPGNYEIKYQLKNYLDDSLNVQVSSSNLSSLKIILVDTTLWHSYTTKNSAISTNNLTCITIDNKGVIWAGTSGNGVLSFDGNNWGGNQLFATLPSSYVNCVTVNKNDTLFIGTNRGFVTYDGFNKHMYGFKTSGLPNFWVNTIGFDDSGNWFIGTQGGLTESNGSFWYTFNSETIPDTSINTIFNDNSNNLWVGMKSHGIAVRNSNNNWIYYYSNGFSIINNNVRAFAESPLGEIWVGFGKLAGSGAGLSYYYNNNWQNAYVLPPSSQTNAILIDRNNVKWVATDEGLVRFTNSADAILFNYDNTGLNINDVTGIAQDSKGNIWISTNGGGLVEYKGH